MPDTIYQGINLTKIRRCISDARLSSYTIFIDQKEVDDYTIFPYITLQLAEALFYTPIQTLEITMRNLININLIEYYSGRAKKIKLPGTPEEWYVWMPERQENKDKIASAVTKAHKEIKGRKVTADDIICRFTFGTWVNLLKERTGNKDPLHFWQGIAREVFPNTKDNRTEKVEKLGRLNALRNRIFHHEPAWETSRVTDLLTVRGELIEIYRQIWEMVRSMSEDTFKLHFNEERDQSKSFLETLDGAIDLCMTIKSDLKKFPKATNR